MGSKPVSNTLIILKKLVMKKIIFTLALAFVATFSYAQEFGFGPKVGLNYSMVSGDVTEAPTARYGLNIGAFAEYKFTKLWAVEGALMYSAQGVNDKWDAGEGVTVKSKIKADYLNVPLLAKCYVAGGFNVFIGPQFGFLLSAKNHQSAPGFESQTDNIKDDCNKVSIAGVAGFGYQFKMGLNLSAGFQYGFNDTFTSEIDGVKYSNHNCVIQVIAG